MSTKPSVETRQPRSQATPLAEDTIEMLRSRIGGLGRGLSTSGQAGTAIRQFVESGPSQLPEEQREAIETTQAQMRESALNQIGEEFSVMGGTQGSPAAFAAAETMSRLVPRQTQQRFAERRRQADQRLRAISEMARIGQLNMAPFIELARTGILPEQTIVGDSPFATITGGIGGLLKGGGQFLEVLGGGDQPGQLPRFASGGGFRRFPRGTQGDLNPEATMIPGGRA